MENLFQPYSGQQVAPVPAGFLESFGQVGRNYQQGLSQLGAGIGQGVANYKQLQQQGKAADTFVKSFDEKGPDGADRNTILDNMGVDRTQFDTLGARDKMAIVSGFMQASGAKSQQLDRQAQAQALQAKAMMLRQNADEADAFQQIAPAASAWTKANPGKNPSAVDVLGWMSGAKLNPRTQGVIMNKLIAGMMNGENGSAPAPANFIQDPVTGARFLQSGRTVMGSGMAPGTAGASGDSPIHTIADDQGNEYQVMTDPKSGKMQIVNRPEKTRPVPESFFSQYGDLKQQLQSAQKYSTADDKTLKATFPSGDPETIRTESKAKLDAATRNLGELLHDYQSQGYGSEDFWQGLRQRHGLPAGTTAAAAGKGSSGGAAGGDRISVWKDGKQFTVPANQKDEAVKAGYSLSAPK